jgi:hypothetical protein
MPRQIYGDMQPVMRTHKGDGAGREVDVRFALRATRLLPSSEK